MPLAGADDVHLRLAIDEIADSGHERDRMVVRHVLVKCFLVTPDFNIADYFSVKEVDGEFVDHATVVVLGCRGDREHGVGESLSHPRAGPG